VYARPLDDELSDIGEVVGGGAALFGVQAAEELGPP
jgi:hypothetical protein